MNRYINSFSISILLHILLACILIFSYTTIQIKPNKKEKTIKIRLSSIVNKKQNIPSVPKIETTKPMKKPIKKIKSKIKHKVKKQKIVKKKIIKIKKTPIKKKIDKVKKLESLKPKVITLPTKPKITKKVVEVVKKVNLEKEYIDENMAKIIELLKENLYYPRSARKRGITGKVIVKFRLNKDSSIDGIKIVSSHSDILSRSAIKTIKNLSFIFPKPKRELLLQLPINYNLKR